MKNEAAAVCGRSMARIGAVCALTVHLTACTSMELSHSTEAHANTFTDIVAKVVLNNLAMFTQNQGAVPAQVVVTQGSITISDQTSPSFNFTWPPTSRMLGMSASRTWEESWSVVPVTDYASLTTLRYLYANCAANAAFDSKFVSQLAQTEIKDVDKLGLCSAWLEKGNVLPGSTIYGRYGSSFVWVKAGQEKAFGDFVMQVMQVAGNAPKAQTFTFPGAVVPPRR